MGLISKGAGYSAGTNVSISADKKISATDTNTTYSAGTGLTLTGTQFKNPAMRLSTNEQVVGKWINGQTLYSRTYFVGPLSAVGNTPKYTLTGITNNSARIVYTFGYAFCPTENVLISLPFANTVGANSVAYHFTYNATGSNQWEIFIKPGNNRGHYTEAYVTLYYTK